MLAIGRNSLAQPPVLVVDSICYLLELYILQLINFLIQVYLVQIDKQPKQLYNFGKGMH